ncbi:MAG: LysR family transcriptional regulator [Pacificimonas sp.]
MHKFVARVAASTAMVKNRQIRLWRRVLPDFLLTDDEFLNFRQKTSLRQIEIICSVFREGSIAETARLLGMSPANVSLTCDRFENHFSFLVFEKRRNGVVFTKGAQVFIAELQKLEACTLAIGQTLVCGTKPATFMLGDGSTD